MNSLRNSFATDCADFRGSDQAKKIREGPRNPWPDFLRGASGKRQQRNISRLLDGQGQTPLVRGANPGQPPWDDLPAFRHELGEQTNVLVIDGLNFLYAELANFLAAKIFASTFAAARATGTGRTAFPVSE
jgi:hypothetical protein